MRKVRVTLGIHVVTFDPLTHICYKCLRQDGIQSIQLSGRGIIVGLDLGLK